MARTRTSFAAGNQAALRHGGRSQQQRERWRRELLDSMRSVILAELPETPPAGTHLLVDLAAAAAADVRQLHEYVNSQGGLVSPRGQLRKCAEMMRGRERDLLGLFDRLGFGPRAAAHLVATLGTGQQGLAGMLAARRQQLEAGE